MRMFDKNLEQQLLQDQFDHYGLHGVLHLVEERARNGRLFDSASALLFAAHHAHLVTQGERHNILVDKRQGQYTIHVWVEKYSGFVTFGFEASGYGYHYGMNPAEIALSCIDAIDTLECLDWIDVDSGKADDLRAFQAELKRKKEKVRRMFEVVATHS